MEALVLAGGKGVRLQSVVTDRPKPMASIAGRPFLEYLLLMLRAQGVKRAVLCTGYMGDAVEEYFGVGQRLSMDIAYSREPEPLGTGGAIRYALKHTKSNRFLVLNGDSYCPIDLNRLLAKHLSLRAAATLWLVPMPDCGRYGRVEIDGNGSVLAFHEKSQDSRQGLVNAGLYLMEREVVECIPEGRGVSLEMELFPAWIGHGLYAIAGEGPFLDIGTPESYAAAERFLSCHGWK